MPLTQIWNTGREIGQGGGRQRGDRYLLNAHVSRKSLKLCSRQKEPQ